MPVRTYYPGVRERSQAVRLTLRGGTTAVADIRILRAPVFAIKGRVYDDDGKPVNAYLRLLPSEILEDAEAIATAIDGVFEFRDVPAGDWRVSATFEGGGKRLSGSASVLLGRHDVENFAIRLAAPFSLSASVEPADSIKDPGLELFPVDAPPTLAAFARAGAEGKAEFPRVYPGRYRVNVYAEIPDHYLDSILIGSEEVLGKDATFAECMPPVRVIFKPNAAGIRGAIENCGIAQVLLLPHEEGLWNYRFIKRAGCDATGHFTISGLRPGEYYVLGLDRIDPTGLDDLPTLRRLASMASHVQIDPGRITYLDLKIQSWPE